MIFPHMHRSQATARAATAASRIHGISLLLVFGTGGRIAALPAVLGIESVPTHCEAEESLVLVGCEELFSSVALGRSFFERISFGILFDGLFFFVDALFTVAH